MAAIARFNDAILQGVCDILGATDNLACDLLALQLAIPDVSSLGIDKAVVYS
jgi:hypothetical protein